MRLLLAILLLAGADSAACDYGRAHPEAPPETAQFAFLIGEFRISLHGWQEDGWPPAAIPAAEPAS